MVIVAGGSENGAGGDVMMSAIIELVVAAPEQVMEACEKFAARTMISASSTHSTIIVGHLRCAGVRE